MQSFLSVMLPCPYILPANSILFSGLEPSFLFELSSSFWNLKSASRQKVEVNRIRHVDFPTLKDHNPVLPAFQSPKTSASHILSIFIIVYSGR